MAYTLDRANAQYAEALGIGYTGRDNDKAAEYFEEARELGANSPQFHNNFGVLLQGMGRVADAEREFTQAVDLEPTNAEYRANLAAAYMSGGKVRGGDSDSA